MIDKAIVLRPILLLLEFLTTFLALLKSYAMIDGMFSNSSFHTSQFHSVFPILHSFFFLLHGDLGS